VADVARKRRKDAGWARSAVHEARERGLLTRSMWGSPGGELTPKAEALLKKRRKE
jgi:hypothetical protein